MGVVIAAVAQLVTPALESLLVPVPVQFTYEQEGASSYPHKIRSKALIKTQGTYQVDLSRKSNPSAMDFVPK